MKFVRERVDHRNLGVFSHLFEHALFVNARDDALYPAFQVARHVGDRFAFAQARLRVVQEHDEPAHALDAYLERDPGAQGGLLENQRNVFVA